MSACSFQGVGGVASFFRWKIFAQVTLKHDTHKQFALTLRVELWVKIQSSLKLLKKQLIMPWIWRRRWDSNPRNAFDVQRFSRPPHSTTLPLLRRISFTQAKTILPVAIVTVIFPPTARPRTFKSGNHSLSFSRVRPFGPRDRKKSIRFAKSAGFAAKHIQKRGQ